MKNTNMYLRNQLAMALLISFSFMQWGCLEEMEPRELRRIQPVERPSVTHPEPGTRNPNPRKPSNQHPTEKMLVEKIRNEQTIL